MKATPASTTPGYVGLLSCAGKISRFGRQARLGERVDSGLTASRLSEFATLDKMRLRYRTRLGRFITSPRRLAVLRCASPQSHFPYPILGTRPHVAWGQAPKSVPKTLRYFNILRSYRLNSKDENSMRNILGLILLRSKKV